MTIYELTDDYLNLLEAMQDPDYDPEIIQEMLVDAEGSLEEKADSYAKVMKELQAKEVGIDAEIKRLQAMKKNLTTNEDRIKDTLQMMMEATGKTKFKTSLFSFGIQNNPPKVVVDKGIDDLPLEYLVPQDPTINKTLIMEKLKAGEVLEFAHLEQGQSLRIR